MTGIRRALILSFCERYFSLALGFVLIAVVSRLLTPEEIGVSAVGIGIMAIALSLREFATPEFLIQRHDVTHHDVRTAFTILLGLTGLIACALFALAPWLATFYGEPRLSHFLYLIGAASLLEAFAMPLTTLLRRDMAFGTLAVITIAAAVTSAVLTVSLAALGFSYMSFAWAWLCAAAVTVITSLWFLPNFWIFRPSLRSWRAVLNFGSCNGVTSFLNKAYEALPQLILGRILPLDMVGLYNRAVLVCGIPDRVVLAGIFAVAFPAIAGEVRKGRSIREPYLRAISYITVIYWPALIVLVLLARPAVLILLGGQWLRIVPLVQIMGVATLFWFAVILSHQVLVAVGAIRDNVVANLIARLTAAVVLCVASFFGLTVLVASYFLTMPFQMCVAFYFLRRHVPFQWTELLKATWKSAAVAACSAVGPALIIATTNAGSGLSIGETLAAILLSAVGWLAGIWLMRHPFASEIHNAVGLAQRGYLGVLGLTGRPAAPDRRSS